jgi:hypothetical protein
MTPDMNAMPDVDPSPVIDFVIGATFSVLPLLYLVLQIAALFVMRGGLRTVAQICAAIMGALLLFVLWASLVMGSNIAPIYIVFALPLLTPILVVLWVIYLWRRRRRPDTRYL